jgi:hypothetical protein
MMDCRVKPGNDDAVDISQNATADRLEAVHYGRPTGADLPRLSSLLRKNIPIPF